MMAEGDNPKGRVKVETGASLAGLEELSEDSPLTLMQDREALGRASVLN